MLNDTGKVVGFVPTVQPGKARSFYEGVLKLPLISVDSFASVFNANGTMLRVTKVAEFKPHPFTILGWAVADVNTTVLDLQAQGVRFEKYAGMNQDERGIWTSPNGAKVAWFKDPDGNVLGITQYP
ncbi:MAG TPA: VOC family protein [Terriglobia bacterium]|nr:VOC family protein [Terriglobia bacterium]